jgi:uncharacterized protein YoaH (UPF0181 family)
MFFRVLAEMAASALAKPLIVPVISSAAGVLGLSSVTQASTGGYSLPSFSGMSSLPGMGWLGTILPGASTGGAGLGVTAGMGGAGEIGASAGLSLSSALGAGALGSLGYSTLGAALGLPQSSLSGLTSGVSGALGMWGGSSLSFLGAAGGPIGAIAGTLLGGILGGSLFGDSSNYIKGNTGLTANMFTGEYSGSGPAGDVYAQTLGPYIEQQSALLKAAIAQELIDSSRIESAMGRSVEGRGGIYGAAMGIGAGELATGRVNMAVEDINWQEYVDTILVQDLEKFTSRWAQQLGILMPDLKDVFQDLGGITGELIQAITVVPDGIEKIAEYMEEGLTAAEAITQIQADYQREIEILRTRETGRYAINQMFGTKQYPSTYLNSIGATGTETHSLLGGIFADQKVVWGEVEQAWQSLNDQFEQGIIDASQYNSILSYVLQGHQELLSAEQELADARNNSVSSIEQLLDDLRYGGFAGPQSIEQYAGRFGDLYSTAINSSGAEQSAAIENLMTLTPQYLDFAQAYGGFGELRTDLITLFEALREDAAGDKDYHIHIQIDGKEIAHVVATQLREGNPELISAVGVN